MTTHQLRVSEVFGPTLQGEGPAAGMPAVFVRLGGCNLSCSWCDSAYTWDASRFTLAEEIGTRDVDGLVAEVVDRAGDRADLVVLTGGEPLLQQGPAMEAFLVGLRAAGLRVHVETNGTVAPRDPMLNLVQLFVVSPKLPNAGEHRGHQDPAVSCAWGVVRLAGLAHVVVKVVCSGPADVPAAVALAEELHVPRRWVWVMPEGTTPAVVAERFAELADAAVEHGVNLSHRLHVAAWGDERGR